MGLLDRLFGRKKQDLPTQQQGSRSPSHAGGTTQPPLPQDEGELPVFRYHPDPLATGAIVNETTTCPVCGRDRDYAYRGPFFSVHEVEDICPWCIKSGAAARKYDGEFQDGASVEDGASKESIDEVIHRTPGYSGWQQEQWLSHCGECCAFLGQVGWDEIKGLAEELQEDFENGGCSAEMQKSLQKGGSPQGYLFRCVRCGKHRFTWDCD